MDTSTMLFAVILIVIIIIIPFWAWHLRRSREMVEKWASANSYSIMAIERRYLARGRSSGGGAGVMKCSM